MFTSLFAKEKERAWNQVGRKIGRSWGRGKGDQNIFSEEIILIKKEAKTIVVI